MPFRLAKTVRACLTLSATAFLSTAAYAASFDFGAARSPIDHAICNDADLSALDSELADAYRTVLKGDADSADELRSAQRQWLKSRAPDGKIDPDSLKNAYCARIAELTAIPVIGVLPFVYPLTAIVVDAVVYGRALSVPQMGGMVLIVVASLGVNLGWPLLSLLHPGARARRHAD